MLSIHAFFGIEQCANLQICFGSAYFMNIIKLHPTNHMPLISASKGDLRFVYSSVVWELEVFFRFILGLPL